MRLTVTGQASCDLALAREAVREALAHAKLPADARVALALVDDATIRALNARHRRVDRVTDVLAFGQAIPPGVRGGDAAARLRREVDGALDVGDVVIANEVAARQARRRRWSVAEEVAYLAAHGALHLVGYEDDTPEGYREMRKLGQAAMLRARAQKMGRRGEGLRPARRPPSRTRRR